MYSFGLYAILSFLSSFVYLLVAVYIFSKNPKATVNRLFLLVAVTMAAWGFGEGMQRAATDPASAFFWSVYVLGPGATIHCPALVHFWLEFSRKTKKKLQFSRLFFIYLPMVIFLILRFLRPELLIEKMELNYWGYSVLGTPLYRLYTLLIAIYIGSVVVLAFKTMKSTRGNYRKQARNIAVGILLSLTVGIVTQIIFPAVQDKTIPELSVISTFLFIFFIAYAVSKYELLSITPKTISDNIINTMNDYLVVFDKNFEIVLVSQSLLTHGKYSQDNILGKPVNTFVKSNILSLSFNELQNKLPLSNYQAKLTGVGEMDIPISANISSLQDSSGEAVGVLLVMRDMREISELINNLSKRKKELESKNAELKKFNKMVVGREMKIIELKKKLKKLEEDKAGSGFSSNA